MYESYFLCIQPKDGFSTQIALMYGSLKLSNPVILFDFAEYLMSNLGY